MQPSVDSTLELEIPDKKSPDTQEKHGKEQNGVTNPPKTCLNIQNDDYTAENGAMSLPILSKPRSSRSPSVATLVSPTTPLVSAMSASSSFSWSRERALEQQIDTLRETLKDTEERLHSLRLQYDNVSQMHRAMRDKNHQMQDEMDRLKIDAQHLHECANILRNELQAARKDREEALAMQTMLQRELETSRVERRRATDEVESNGRQIMDLQRQCKEMERILARKNPDAMQMLLGKIDGDWKFNWMLIDIFIFGLKERDRRRRMTNKPKQLQADASWNRGLHSSKVMPKNKIAKPN